MSFVTQVAAVLALARGLHAQIGNPVPEFVPVEWINSPAVYLEELRGKAVLIEIFRTWSDECAAQEPGLSARYAKDAARGLVVIGVTDEAPDAVARWVRIHEPSYPVVAIKGGEFERALGARGDWFPIEAVVDAQGTLVHSTGLAQGGFEPALAAALAGATKGTLWPKKLERVLAAIRARAIDKAWIELDKLGTALPEPEAASAGELREFVAARAAEIAASSRVLFEQGRIFEAQRAIAPLVKVSPPLPNHDDCAKLAAEIEAVPELKGELKAGEALALAYELEVTRDYSQAAEGYRALIKKHTGLRATAAARNRLEELTSKGLLGYAKDCADCVRGNKACERHASKPEK